ncbi:hypothetical protein RI367_007481 [Sorochytrium milnesiophthora]
MDDYASPDNFDFADPPPFDTRDYWLTVVALLAFSSAVTPNLILTSIFARHRAKAVQARVSAMLTLNMIAADLLFCSAGSLGAVFKVVAGRYSLGFVGCQIEGFLLSVTVLWSEFAGVLLGAERFVAIVMERHFSPRFWGTVAAGTWSVIMLLAAMPILLGFRFVMEPSHQYCQIKYWGTSPAERARSLLGLSLHVIHVVATAIIYGCIYRKVQAIQREHADVFTYMHRRSVDSRPIEQEGDAKNDKTSVQLQPTGIEASARMSSTSPIASATASVNTQGNKSKGKAVEKSVIERQVFNKACAISVASLLSWLPYVTFILCAYLGAPWSLLYGLDSASAAIAITRCHANIAIISMLDPVARTQLKHMLHHFAESIPFAVAADSSRATDTDARASPDLKSRVTEAAIRKHTASQLKVTSTILKNKLRAHLPTPSSSFRASTSSKPPASPPSTSKSSSSASSHASSLRAARARLADRSRHTVRLHKLRADASIASRKLQQRHDVEDAQLVEHVLTDADRRAKELRLHRRQLQKEREQEEKRKQRQRQEARDQHRMLEEQLQQAREEEAIQAKAQAEVLRREKREAKQRVMAELQREYARAQHVSDLEQHIHRVDARRATGRVRAVYHQLS